MSAFSRAASLAEKAFSAASKTGAGVARSGLAKAKGINPKSLLLGGPGVSKTTAAGIGTGTALFGWDLTSPVREAVRADPDRQYQNMIEAERALMNQRAAQGLRRQRLERDMAGNAARLAAVAPDLYNQVLAGRRLPRGAVVLGGQPRTDLLEEVAMRMSDNAFRTPDPLEGL